MSWVLLIMLNIGHVRGSEVESIDVSNKETCQQVLDKLKVKTGELGKPSNVMFCFNKRTGEIYE